MKNILFTTIAFLLITVSVNAQYINIGIKGGFNGYTIYGDNTTGYNPKLGFNAGLLGHLHLSTRFAFQPEIVYSVQGTTYKIGAVDNFLNLNYVNIPLNLQYMYDNGFRIQAGPQFGILTSANLEVGDNETDLKANYKNTDIGVTIGMSYVKPSTGFGVDIRYNYGLTNINSNDAINSFNSGVQLTFFYLFQHRS